MKINMPLYILCTMSQFLNFKSRKFRQKQDLYIILTLKLLLSSIIHTSIQLFQLRLSTRRQSGKVEYERERLLGIANKLMNFQSDSQQPFALVFDFSALLVDNLN